MADPAPPGPLRPAPPEADRAKTGSDGSPPLLDMLAIAIDREQEASPLYHQVYEAITTGIERGVIRPGDRLPSTRKLASELNVSRTTVVLAFEQLTAEGWIEGQSGAGSFVSEAPPLTEKPRDSRLNPALEAAGGIGRTAEMRPEVAQVPPTLRHMRRPVPFRSNLPAIDAFPTELWARCLTEVLRRLKGEQAAHILGEGDPQGLFALREQVAIHVARTRGVVCTASEVVIFAGAQQAVDLCSRLLLMPSDKVICEDPGYDGIYASAVAVSALPVPVPVDEHGLIVAEARKRAPDARMIYSSPSKQFPLGCTLSLRRRIELIDWVRESGAWILEDDYDCEFRYAGKALPSLFSLDDTQSVIYLGTFSKSLFPALRLGYAILPKRLIEPVVSARTVLDRYAAILPQLQVAHFMRAGHFAKHVRRMRKLYSDRQELLLDAMARELQDWLIPQRSETGFELVARVSPRLTGRGITARDISKAARSEGMELQATSAFGREPREDDRLVLGFATFTGEQIDRAARQLAQICRDLAGEAGAA
ncbi:PLP-dependent aminotransferase family protein [Salipiger sp.]|uniref:MocR-like pyridoxine biosynthesis transcription factor PdxR n=1 Tax=Salipiger sp. TaxID=2078585 RepID=UPI003A96F141